MSESVTETDKVTKVCAGNYLALLELYARKLQLIQMQGEVDAHIHRLIYPEKIIPEVSPQPASPT